MDSTKKAELQDAIVCAIKEANRCLYNWHLDKKQYIDQQEINSLIINWLNRTIKTVLGHRLTSGIFRGGKPTVSCNSDRTYITGIFFPLGSSYYYTGKDELVVIKEMCDNLDYPSMKFEPSLGLDYSYSFSNVKTLLDEVKSLDMSLNFKF